MWTILLVLVLLGVASVLLEGLIWLLNAVLFFAWRGMRGLYRLVAEQ